MLEAICFTSDVRLLLFARKFLNWMQRMIFRFSFIMLFIFMRRQKIIIFVRMRMHDAFTTMKSHLKIVKVIELCSECQRNKLIRTLIWFVMSALKPISVYIFGKHYNKRRRISFPKWRRSKLKFCFRWFFCSASKGVYLTEWLKWMCLSWDTQL